MGRVLDRSRYRGALLGALVGDALGAPFEGRRGLVGEKEWSAAASASSPLCYTDDTAMTVAFAESLLRYGELEQNDLAAAFADQWADAPGLGYSSRTSATLERLRSGTPWTAWTAWTAAAGSGGRASNGAAM